MGKKRRGHPDVEELLARPWCYYCERDFEDLKLLISHQKAKHFKCDRCGRRLNTAGGLSVHMNQVHKETLTQVENALPNRQGLDVEIFGMEGMPADILEQHRNRIIQTFYQAQENRRIATGNPLPGQGSGGHARKKIHFETDEELLKRFAEWRALKKAGALPAAATTMGMEGVEKTHGQQDDIDQLIRSAEAGAGAAARPQVQEEEGGEKRGKKEKKARLVYDDAEISPEERMAAFPRYAYGPAAAAA